MPIPDEAREAWNRSGAAHGCPGLGDQIDEQLTSRGYTVVKLPTVAEWDAAIDKAFGPHDHTAEFCDGCTAGELVLSVLGVRSLPLGEGKTDG